MKKGIIMLIVLCLCGVAQAVSLESILFGDPPELDVDARLEAVEESDPVFLELSLNAGPDLDNVNNEFSLAGGLRYNLFVIGPNVTFWPKGEDKTAWGIYTLRYLGYENFIIGRQFFGFKTTFDTGKGGGMYAFVGGNDVEIQKDLFIRTMVEYRDFRRALADTHDESEELFVSIAPVFLF
jgi:hypothetical protein